MFIDILKPALISKSNTNVLYLTSYSSTAVALNPTYECKPSLIIYYRLAVQGASAFLLTSCSSCISPSPVPARPGPQPGFTSGAAAHHHKGSLPGESEDWGHNYHQQPVEKSHGLATRINWDTFVNVCFSMSWQKSRIWALNVFWYPI